MMPWIFPFKQRFGVPPFDLSSNFIMAFLSFAYVLITLFILCFSSPIHAQQPYVGLATTDCNNADTTSNSNSALGYSCNGLNKSCRAYLTFRSQPPFNTVASISTLLGSEPSLLSQINSVSLETNRLVIVPVNCSCSGQYYQSNTTYTIQNGDTYLFIANNTFQGLSTCQALEDQNGSPTNLIIGAGVTVPLRCACPTENQTDEGFPFLLSYLVAEGDTVSGISSRFGVDTGEILQANSLSGSNIFPFTTLLIPLENPPTSSQTVEPPSSTPVIPPPPPANSSSEDGSNKTWIYIVAGVLGGITLTLIFGATIFCKFFYTRKKEPDSIVVSGSFQANEKPSNKKFDEESQDFLESISGVAQSLKVYSFKELQSATDNFSFTCRIQGSVYRGKINGGFAAIKKVNGDVSKEIALLNKINHSNLIILSGVCFNEGNCYLVYEYAVNGTLSDWVFSNKNEGKYLDWKQRIQIALDVATGLNYLHSFTNPPHVHKDINSSNVLLDSDLRAKIANFAMARPTEGQEGEFALTRHIVGTKGYMAPEYLENGLVSTKLDVYAFGVLILEMLTGKEAAALHAEENNMHLSDVLNAVLTKEDGEESLRHFIDPTLQGNYPLELALLVIRLIDACLKKDPTDRPTMYEIEHSLSNILNASLNW
ncbi:LysM domain receptor-like kinase 4 [Citrus sinensis]|uniref:LysM domain receptor-like kinase 4 n=2 Tax=Citrus sinensis TaxID=2711 RepID=A0ACB8J1Y6_CITSI|nr:LysM domain receptor-like kinase 4 [Citrus sinensis]